jgi:hypothetical protein
MGGESAAELTPGMKAMMLYFMPVMSIAFCSWLPATTQLTFMTGGLVAGVQSFLFRQSWFRNLVGLHPIVKFDANQYKAGPGAYEDLKAWAGLGDVTQQGQTQATYSQESINLRGKNSNFAYRAATYSSQSPSYQAPDRFGNRSGSGKVVDTTLSNATGASKRGSFKSQSQSHHHTISHGNTPSSSDSASWDKEKLKRVANAPFEAVGRWNERRQAYQEKRKKEIAEEKEREHKARPERGSFRRP